MTNETTPAALRLSDQLGTLPEPDYMTPMKGVLYSAASLRTYASAAVAAERERCAQLCDTEAAGFGGVAAGPMATEYGKLVHEAMAAGAMNCAASIRGPNFNSPATHVA